MDIQNMHIAVRQGVDKINSLQADSLLSEELDLELNKNMRRFINLKYGKNNQYNKGFEESQKRIDDLSTLISEHRNFVGFKDREMLGYYSTPTNSKYLFREFYKLPYDYMHHIESSCNGVRSLKADEQQFRLELYNDNDYVVDASYETDSKYFVFPYSSMHPSNSDEASATIIVERGFTTGNPDPDYANDFDASTTVAGAVLTETLWEMTNSNSILEVENSIIQLSGTLKAYKDYIIEHVLTNHNDDVVIRWEKSGNLIHKDSFIIILKPDTSLYEWVRTDAEASYVVDAIGSGGYNASGAYVTSSAVYNSAEQFASVVYSTPTINGITFSKASITNAENIIGYKRKFTSSLGLPNLESYNSDTDPINVSYEGLNVPITYVQHDDLHALLKDPFNRPSKNSVFGVFTSDAIELYTLTKALNKSAFIPDSLKLKYLRTPLPMSLTLQIDCELPAHTHEEIVAMTVNSLLEGISDPRYKSHIGELIKQE